MDEFTIEGIEAPDAAAAVEPMEPRPYVQHHLPDGTPLILRAGMVADLAAIFGDEFAGYVPQRYDEFAILLWMASRPPEERGAAWRDGKPPLLSDFAALRAHVSRWLDDTFRASEASYVHRLAIDLWVYHTAARVEIAEKKSPTPEELRSTTLTPSPSASTPSPEETS